MGKTFNRAPAPLKPNASKPAISGGIDAAVPCGNMNRSAKAQMRGSLMHKRTNMGKDKRS